MANIKKKLVPIPKGISESEYLFFISDIITSGKDNQIQPMMKPIMPGCNHTKSNHSNLSPRLTVAPRACIRLARWTKIPNSAIIIEFK